MLPAAVRHEPAVQGEHCAAPAPLKRPGGHGMGAPAAAGVYEPAGVVAQPLSEIAPAVARKDPAGHGFAVPTAVPAGQKKPGGQEFATPVGFAGVDAGQKKPAVHGFVVPAAWPARQKKPAGQGTCAVLATTAGQKEPARQAFDVAAVLEPADERHAPAAQGAHVGTPAAFVALVLK